MTLPQITSAQMLYEVVDLGSSVQPYAINDQGIIVGSVLRSIPKAFVWRQGILDTLRGVASPSTARDINNRNEIVGTYGESPIKSFWWRADTMKNIDSPGDRNIWVSAINSHGIVAGYYESSTTYTSTAFMWKNGTTQDLGAGANSMALGINDSSVIVGKSTSGSITSDSTSAFQWRNGLASKIPSSNYSQTEASSINNSGQIIGMGFIPFHGVGLLWSGASLTEFHGPSADYIPLPISINNKGVVVGYCVNFNFDFIAFGFFKEKVTDLNTVISSSDGWHLSIATDVNNLGQIVGYGTLNNEPRGVLLNPATTDVNSEASGQDPTGFKLFQNYPNPFNPSTTIKFSVETTDRATIQVYNILGQHVVTLFDDVAEAGQFYRVIFSAKGGSASGRDARNLASGMYVYRLQSGNKSDLKKVLLLK